MRKIVLACLLVVLGFSSGLLAVNYRDVDRVREKGVLDSADFAVIEKFISEALDELVLGEDLGSLSQVRTIISSRNEAKAGQQYQEAYYDGLNKYVPGAFAKAKAIADKRKSVIITTNLLILIESLEDEKLVDLAMEYLKSDNVIIRYWAVNCVTSDFVVERFNSSGSPIFSAKIVKLLKDMIGSSDGEILSVIADFSSKIKSTAGPDMLVAIADRRIGEYASWTVDNEIMDSDLMCSLFDVYVKDSSKKVYAQKFGQLFAYAMQRYVKGAGVLSDQQKSAVASSLIEVEQRCLGKALGLRQSVIRKAIENDSAAALQNEYVRLFGAAGKKGELAFKMKFDYLPGGNNPVELKSK